MRVRPDADGDGLDERGGLSMKPFGRNFRAILALVCVLLTLGGVFFWVRSFWASDHFRKGRVERIDVGERPVVGVCNAENRR